MKLGSKRQKLGQGYKRQTGESAEIDHTHTAGKNVAYYQTHKNRQRTEKTLGKNLTEQTGQQGNASYNPVVHTAKIGSALSSGKRVGTYRKKRETDGGNHRSSHNGRNEFNPILGKESKCSLYQSTNDNRTNEGSHALRGGNGDGQRKEGEGNAHHDRQARANAPNGIKLYQRTDTGYDHTVLDKHGAH